MVRYEVPLSNDLLELLTNHGAVPISGPRQPGVSTSTQTKMDSALHTLTSDEATIMWLRFWEQLSFRQIQREMGHKSVSQTHRLYKTTINKLRKVWDEDNS